MNQLFLPFVIITALHVLIAPRHSYIGISYIEVHCIVSDAQIASSSLANMTIYTVFQKKTSTHTVAYKLRNSCLVLIIFDTKIPDII